MKRILRSAVSLMLCAAVALGGTACGRSKLPTTITIIMGDCNYLKRVNDAYGHEYGDLLLKRCLLYTS